VASAARARPPVRGKLDEAGRLVTADAELEALQRDAGGAMGQQLAIPQLAAIARLARDLGTPVSRPAIAASPTEDIEMWVSATPGDDGSLELSLEQWRARPAAQPRLEQLVASSDNEAADGLAPLEWTADDELRIIALSADFAKLVGIDPEAAAGMPLTRLVQLEENDDGDMPLIGALAARHGFSGQLARLRSGSGGGIILSGEIVTAADGGFAGFRGGAQPTGEAGAEPAQTAGNPADLDQSLDEVLRQPLRRILESADRIMERADGPLRGDYASYGNDIAAAARHLSSVIEGMRGGDGDHFGEAFEAQTVDVSALAAEAVVMVEPAAEARDVQFELHTHRPLHAAAEERAVIQILVNLMGNAVRYSDPGGTVHILFSKTDGTVAVSVRDEGPGIDLADQERIFERFERADSGGGGTGLGLAISRRLARSMGGDIGVESRPGFGSTFTLILPGA
jgi:signal transduction histidine kinase